MLTTDALNLDLHYDKNSISFDPLRCVHRVRDRARKIRLVDHDCCDGDPIGESDGTSASNYTREALAIESEHLNEMELKALTDTEGSLLASLAKRWRYKAKTRQFLQDRTRLAKWDLGDERSRRFTNCSARTALSILICSLVPVAFAQQAETLQQQLDQLKEQYKQDSQQLQQRISVLEQQIEQQKEEAAKEKEEREKEKEKTVSAAELATEHEAKKVFGEQSNQVGSKFQGQIPADPTYDLLQEAETKIKGLERQVGEFEFHGYLRSGYGLNSEGGQQVAFEAPGALAKYRLGNEAETYGEFIFVGW